MKVHSKKRFIVAAFAGLLLATTMVLLPRVVAAFQDSPVKIRFTRFEKDVAGLKVAIFEFTNSSPKDLNIRVPGVDMDGRGGVGTLVFNIDGGMSTHVSVLVPTNNSRLRIRASYLTTPAWFRRGKVTGFLNRRLNLTLTNSEFFLAPTVDGPTVDYSRDL